MEHYILSSLAFLAIAACGIYFYRSRSDSSETTSGGGGGSYPNSPSDYQIK